MTHDKRIEQFEFSQLVRALGQPLLMSPLAQMATIGISPQQAGSASALFNMMRNLGGSVGIAMLSTTQALAEMAQMVRPRRMSWPMRTVSCSLDSP